MSKSTTVGCTVILSVLLCLGMALPRVRADHQDTPVEEGLPSTAANADSAAAQDPEPAEAETPSVTREQLLELFERNTVPATDFESVASNHRHRLYNIMKAFPERDDYQRVIMDFVNIGRPPEENEVLATYGEELLALDDEDKKCRALAGYFVELQHYSSNDIRLFLIAQRAIEGESGAFSMSMVKEALIAIGMIRVPEAVIYLQKACRESYWELLYRHGIKGRELNARDVTDFRLFAVWGITNLPEDEAIPLLESTLGTTETFYRSVYFRLDEVWRRKKGLPSIHKSGGTRHDYDDPTGRYDTMVRIWHPDYLFGIRGERLEKPFGEGPKTSELHVNLPF